jgi:FkbM family methyltransferase
MSSGARAATVTVLSQLRLLVNRAGYDVTRDHFKHRFVYALHQAGIDSVLDIGANVGQFGAQLRRAGFSGRIHSVEPLQNAFAQLQVSAAGDGRWTAQCAAVSAAPGTLRINVSGNSVSSSVLPMLDRHAEAAPQAQYVGAEDVVATTVDAIVAEHRLDPERTLLKIDVQGYEDEVLAGAAKSLDRFVGVRTEMSLVALYDGQLLMPEMVDLLTGHGLELWYLEPGFVDPQSRRLLQLDGLFLRPSGAAAHRSR